MASQRGHQTFTHVCLSYPADVLLTQPACAPAVVRGGARLGGGVGFQVKGGGWVGGGD